KGMGEMQTLASGVGDLKKVLSNVKTRGIFGEIQLGAILEQILSPEQYDQNVITKPGSSDPVEFAVKFPGDDQQTVYLPIDSKFPLDVYQHVLNAYDTGDKETIERASRDLYSRIRQEAKKIRDKYVQVPYTTDFAILFLPVEGLYAEAVRIGVVDEIQRLYRVSVAGPTTMAALLNSFQMGFRTLAIQKRSSEVWKVLGEVRTEFDTFGTVLQNAQTRIVKANEELDKLIGVRTRKIQKKLKDVSEFSIDENRDLMG
ncbi:MAG: DNA recombination protein RmuC, partial [Oscillospiraceae bacterium]|nr:DNA recombination protein RmuC [Oscillospiraceae bacterium]